MYKKTGALLLGRSCAKNMCTIVRKVMLKNHVYYCYNSMCIKIGENHDVTMERDGVVYSNRTVSGDLTAGPMLPRLLTLSIIQ